MNLSELSMPLGSDKAPWGHGYTQYYDQVFAPLRHLPIRLLEIGVNEGASIRLWLEYFTEAQIFGIDLVKRSGVAHERYRFVQGDQSKEEFWLWFLAQCPGKWDVVIDDGSHYAKDIILSFGHLWPEVGASGLYVIEDLACAYDPTCQSPGCPSQMEFVKALMEDINLGRQSVESLHFTKELAIFKKRA